MKLFIADNYEAMSQQAAVDVIELLSGKEDAILCAASGNTPEGLYKELVEKVKNKEADIDNWFFLGLDEWVGMNGGDEGSCRFHVNNHLLFPLKVASDRIIFFDGRVTDLQNECKRVEDFIHEHRNIHVSILGMGMNGHIGMNEPGTSVHIRSHVCELHPITQEVGQKYFTQAQQLSNGITLGLGTLMESEHIILLISGKHKSPIVKEALEGKISENVPASLLRSHPGLRIYLDKDAAQLLSQ